MHIRIKRDRIGTRFVRALLSGLLLVALMLAMPSMGNAENIKMVIAPPKTSGHVDLKPYDPAVMVRIAWLCVNNRLNTVRNGVQNAWLMIKIGDDAGAYILKKVAQDFSDEEKRAKGDARIFFWGAAENATFTLDPPQGGTRSVTVERCFTRAELEANMREAIRWAKYILNVYMPKNFK